MRSLMLLRHSKAVPAGGNLRDHERMLDPRGREEAAKMGVYMARHGLVPDEVIVSTASRTRETWALAAPAFAAPPLAVFDERLYDAAPDTILEVAKAAPQRSKSLLLIGHNPGLHKAAVMLLATGDVEARERLIEQLPTTGLVTIEFAFDDWKQLRPQSGRLDHFVTPRSFAVTTD